MSNRKFDVDDNYFDNIDNQEKAYYFGLLYADGCNYEEENLVKIDLNEDDIEILEKFSKAICYTGDIKHYNSETQKMFTGSDKIYECKPLVRLSFRSMQLSKQLALKGCVSNKSKYGIFPNSDVISDELLRHFIRGYMDGNGGISFWIDNENTGHKKFSIHFCGTSDIIQHLSDLFRDKFNCMPDVRSRYEDRDNNNLQMIIDGNRVVEKILDWLYCDASVYLNRKYEKYMILKEEIKRVDNDTNLYGNAFKRRPIINLETKEVYSGVNKAGDAFGVKGSTIFSWCKKHNKVMYLDEYQLLHTS